LCLPMHYLLSTKSGNRDRIEFNRLIARNPQSETNRSSAPSERRRRISRDSVFETRIFRDVTEKRGFWNRDTEF